MKFSDLNDKRKLAVQLLIEKYPNIKDTGVISLAELRAWWDEYSLTKDRTVGWPSWLNNDKAFRHSTRGMYKLPVPQESDVVAVAKKKLASKVKTLNSLTKVKKETTMVVESNLISKEEFMRECEEAGIEL